MSCFVIVSFIFRSFSFCTIRIHIRGEDDDPTGKMGTLRRISASYAPQPVAAAAEDCLD